MIRTRMICIGVLAAACTVPAMAGTPSFSAGANYSTGKYGTTTTTSIWSVPFTFGYDTGSWHFKLTVPYIRITGTGDVVPGVGKVKNTNPLGLGLGRNPLFGGGQPTGQTTTTSTTASGLGDVVAQASYTLFYDTTERFGMDLGTRIKFGTADANKGLGTGQNDYGLNLDAYKGIGNWTLFGGVGYTRYGSSQYIKLKNGANANAGFSYKVDDGNSVGAYYYYRERIATTGYAQSEVSAFWNHNLGNTLRFQAYALTGFTHGSPDWGGGASLRWSF